jgi:hypothetical protein
VARFWLPVRRMPNKDRMFQVIVLGGIALGAGSAVTAAGCTSTESAAPDAEAPVDTGTPADAEAPVVDAGQDAHDAWFPYEGPDAQPPVDASPDASDAWFPYEGPDAQPPVDASPDASDALPDGPENG